MNTARDWASGSQPHAGCHHHNGPHRKYPLRSRGECVPCRGARRTKISQIEIGEPLVISRNASGVLLKSENVQG